MKEFFEVYPCLTLVFFPGNKIDNSASESDSSSLDGGAMLPPTTVTRDQLQKRIESLQQQNRYEIYINISLISGCCFVGLIGCYCKLDYCSDIFKCL